MYNNTSYPEKLVKKCYSKHISLLNNNLKPKSLKQLEKDCAENKNINQLSKNYKIPPLKERAYAIRKIQKNKSVNNAKMMAQDPWYSPLVNNGKLVYLQISPRAGQTSTFPKNHDAYKLMPTYFPAPNNAKPLQKSKPRTPKPIKPKQAKSTKRPVKHSRPFTSKRRY